MPVLPPPSAPAPPAVWFDPGGHVVEASAAARDLFAGAPLASWLDAEDRDAVADVVGRLLAGDAASVGVQVLGPTGLPVWLTLRRDAETPGRAVGTVRRGRAAPGPSPRMQADRLRLLATVTSRGAAPLAVRLRRALRLTSELLGLELAIVSRIEATTFTVVAAVSPDDAIEPGTTFDLGDTFCSITFGAPDVFVVNGVAASPHRTHPCYELFALESYVGVTVSVRGVPWGTLTFSSTKPLADPLAPADLDLVRLLALWVGGEVEHEDDREALASSERRYRALSEATFEGIAFSVGGVVTDCNRQFARLLGYGDVADVVGRPAGDFVAPHHVATVGRMIAEDHREPYEIQALRADGSLLWIAVQGRVQDLGDGPVRVTAVRDVSARRALSEQLAHQATHDALTGLPNRTLFYSRIEAALADGAPFAVLFVDLDRFKVVNDSLGHETGDFLLATVAERLRSALGAVEGATVARLGGDEFGVVVPTPGGAAPDAREVAEHLLATLNEPVDLGPRRHEPGASVGVVEAAHGYATPEDVLRDADTAMYEAKRAGRGRATAFGPAMREAATDRFRLEHDLRRAIAGDELRVHFQPIVRLDDGAVAGFESLVRWAHPERGLLAPDAFLPLAEELGLVAAIDEWVLGATLAALRDGLGAPDGALIWLSVNCSDATFLDGALPDRVADVLRASGVDPAQVVLELTERAIVEPDRARGALEKLHGQGVQVCIDDFGTGFSSLALLHGLPVDGLKIDRSFVTDLATSAAARAVVEGVIGIASSLGLRVVAEGVETAAQRDVLAALGCELGQGYLFSRPVPAEEALAMLA